MLESFSRSLRSVTGKLRARIVSSSFQRNKIKERDIFFGMELFIQREREREKTLVRFFSIYPVNGIIWWNVIIRAASKYKNWDNREIAKRSVIKLLRKQILNGKRSPPRKEPVSLSQKLRLSFEFIRKTRSSRIFCGSSRRVTSAENLHPDKTYPGIISCNDIARESSRHNSENSSSLSDPSDDSLNLIIADTKHASKYFFFFLSLILIINKRPVDGVARKLDEKRLAAIFLERSMRGHR